MIAVGVGAGIGAVLRYTVTTVTNHFVHQGFPLATFFINLLGAFGLGWLFGMGVTGVWMDGLGVGVMGGFTTFSTFMNETMVLGETKGQRGLASCYVILSVIGGLIATMAGIWLGHLF